MFSQCLKLVVWLMVLLSDFYVSNNSTVWNEYHYPSSYLFNDYLIMNVSTLKWTTVIDLINGQKERQKSFLSIFWERKKISNKNQIKSRNQNVDFFQIWSLSHLRFWIYFSWTNWTKLIRKSKKLKIKSRNS